MLRVIALGYTVLTPQTTSPILNPETTPSITKVVALCTPVIRILID